MHIWVDADACPRPIKEILFKAAERREVETTLIANQYLHTPPCRFINAIVVAQGFDVADNEIVKRMSMGDLVVTQDIPLADEVVAKGGVAPAGYALYGSEYQRPLIAQGHDGTAQG